MTLIFCIEQLTLNFFELFSNFDVIYEELSCSTVDIVEENLSETIL